MFSLHGGYARRNLEALHHINKTTKRYFKIANSELCNIIAKSDKGTKLYENITQLESILKLKI